MKKCPKCNCELNDRATYCNNCGNKDDFEMSTEVEINAVTETKKKKSAAPLILSIAAVLSYIFFLMVFIASSAYDAIIGLWPALLFFFILSFGFALAAVIAGIFGEINGFKTAGIIIGGIIIILHTIVLLFYVSIYVIFYLLGVVVIIWWLKKWGIKGFKDLKSLFKGGSRYW